VRDDEDVDGALVLYQAEMRVTNKTKKKRFCLFVCFFAWIKSFFFAFEKLNLDRKEQMNEYFDKNQNKKCNARFMFNKY
jgi:hypothetical protein